MEKMDMNGIKSIVETFGTVRNRELFYNDGVKLSGIKAVYNDKFNCHAGVLSDEYTIVQAKEAMIPMLSVLEMTNPTETYFVKPYENQRKCFLALVGRKTIVPSDGQEIRMGYLLKTNHDGTGSVVISGFGVRMACMNQMTMNKCFSSLRLAHWGDHAKIVEAIKAYIYQIGEESQKLLENINRSREEKVLRGTADKILEHLGYGTRNRKKILSNFNVEEESAWGLYNAITAEARTKKSYNATLKSCDKAETLLIAPKQTIEMALTVKQ